VCACSLASCRQTQMPVDAIQNFSICHPLRSTGVTRLRHYYEMIRLLDRLEAVVVSFAGPTSCLWAGTYRGSIEISWGKFEKCLAAPAFTTDRPRSDIGHRTSQRAHPGRPACLKVHFHSVLQYATSFHLTRPHGILPPQTAAWTSVRATAFHSWLPPIGPIEDFHL
jgi:hypothetical protein